MNKNQSEVPHIFSNGIRTGCFNRSRAEDTNWNTYYIRKNHIVGNQTDEFIDLDDDLLDAALKRTQQRKAELDKSWDKDYPAPEIVRQEFRPRTNLLLIIYPLNPVCANVLNKLGEIQSDTISYSKTDEPFIGFVISFPSSNTNIAVSYAVNQVAEFAETEALFDNENDNVYDEQ